jgi:hypothetical protein
VSSGKFFLDTERERERERERNENFGDDVMTQTQEKKFDFTARAMRLSDDYTSF